MKRGSKGEEKIMGPMFPRLHVNDTEKGGPRAPPRNKMALYEQLSVPFQRFKHGVLHNSNKANSLSQGSGNERDVSFSVQYPKSRHPAKKPHSHSSNSKAPLLPVRSNKEKEEDDFTVPIFINSNVSRGNKKLNCTPEGERLSASTAVFSGHSREGMDEENFRKPLLSRQHSCNSTSILSMDKQDGVLRQADVPLRDEPRDDPESSFGIFCKTDLLVSSQVGGATLSEPVRVVDDSDSSPSVKDVTSEEQIIPNNLINDTCSKEEMASKLLQTRIVDQGDDLSETSMVEPKSGMYISPDDVVGVIGQKNFWKARRAISNQQRVFAVQVFELHRLLKVQRLIAGSQSTLEDAANLGKPLKSLSAKRLPLEHIVREPQNVSEQRKDPDMPSVRMECSAENTVEKASFSSVQNFNQPSSYSSFSGNPIQNDSSMGPWCFNQPSGYQWLIPIMSPSEGLIYKPYPGPGATSSVYGSYGPPGSTPMVGNLSAPAYGLPASNHHYQGLSMPFAHASGHPYFPLYSMPVIDPAISSSTIDQSNPFAAQGVQEQLSGGGANFQRQDSSNVPNDKNGAVPDGKSHASGDAELQGSTDSSPTGRDHGVVVDNATEGRNVLPLFPTSPAIENPNSSLQPHFPAHPARIIKVVPHNSRSATESVARIFQSIQEERKQYDSGFPR